ncbi:hypothetical protein CgunFtcFv8_024378 [Champsocephalus gunnari]|uniref:C-type lectin domain-containing protein n=1 Tax=Champsocephalus gunnari TaxID=52237 RepID=A0AAN8DEB5_CHAGU|nr:hypothetical protein CgunFtcFv8_024378 [Champsocephalus gunnari]
MEEINVSLEDVKPLCSRSSTIQEGPRRFPPASVLGLGLLAVFLLAGLIGLAVHQHNSVDGAAADLSAVKANLTERLHASDQLLSSVTEERDGLMANLTEKTREVDRLQSLSKQNQDSVHLLTEERDGLMANITEKTREVDRLQSLSKQKKTCPAGWRMVSCVCYLFSTEKASWQQSRQNCRAKGADLVIIDSNEEQKFMTSTIKEPTWIGLNDIDREGTWKWVDGSLPTQKYWGQPPDNVVKPLKSRRSSAKQEGPRRFLRASVLGLGLLSVFLLAGLIGLAVHHHNSVGDAAADLSTVKANLSSVTEERDNLTRRLQASDQLINQLNASLTEKTREVECLKKACPEGWRKLNCSCYVLSTEKASWEQSRQNCRAGGADLVIVDSNEEQEFITSMIKEQTWIGLNDINQEGTWKWVDGTPLTLKYWGSTLDNGSGDPVLGEEDCASLVAGRETRKNWNDLREILSCRMEDVQFCPMKKQKNNDVPL